MEDQGGQGELWEKVAFDLGLSVSDITLEYSNRVQECLMEHTHTQKECGEHGLDNHDLWPVLSALSSGAN